MTVWKSSSSHKLVHVTILFAVVVYSCYCFGARGIVSGICSVVLSEGVKPFLRGLEC